MFFLKSTLGRQMCTYLVLLFCLIPISAGCNKLDVVTFQISITLVDEFDRQAIPANTIEIYTLNPDGSTSEKPLASQVTDDQGIAKLKLASGVYRAQASGSFVGYVDFSLNNDVKVNLFVQRVLN